jgi:hypothetical protein
VSHSVEQRLPQQGPSQSLEGPAEEVDGLPVPAADPSLPRSQRVTGTLTRDRLPAAAAMPAVQAAAVAAGGFVAGAAVAGLVHRRHRRSAALARGARAGRALTKGGARRGSTGVELLQIVGSRSLLVDVHLLGALHPER